MSTTKSFFAKSRLGSVVSFSAALALSLVMTGGYELSHVNAGVAQAASTSPAPAAASDSLQNLYVNISDKMMPSVVNISTTKKMRPLSRGRRGGIPDEFWNNFFGGNMAPPEPSENEPQAYSAKEMPMSLGTGFIVEAESKGGLILTNYHVIAGADEVKVKFTESTDELEVPAVVVAQDPELDVALLRVKTDRKLMPVTLGDSDRLQVGEWVAAVGNPFGHGHSITHGIVSAKERTLPEGFGKYLQVDAPINPGNSGGPLVNLNAEVIGINNAIDARGPGIGFAIPINSIKAVLARLKEGKTVERGYLGVNITPLKAELARALRSDAAPGTPMVAEVVAGTPAARAGIEPYDVITEINGHKIASTEELMQTIMQVPVGETVQAQIQRGGKHITLEVPVSKRPDPRRA